jgi:hypothetical protein
MLQVNEDMLAAIAEHQNWSDQGPFRSLETAHAYQLILHRNLIEMANFVDSLFGVFVSVVRRMHMHVESIVYLSRHRYCMSMIYRMLMMHHRTKTILTPSLTQDRS